MSEARLNKVESQVAALTTDMGDLKRDMRSVREETLDVKSSLIRIEESLKAQAKHSPRRSLTYWGAVGTAMVVITGGMFAITDRWFAAQVRSILGPSEIKQVAAAQSLEDRVKTLEGFFVIKPSLREWVTLTELKTPRGNQP